MTKSSRASRVLCTAFHIHFDFVLPFLQEVVEMGLIINIVQNKGGKYLEKNIDCITVFRIYFRMFIEENRYLQQ